MRILLILLVLYTCTNSFATGPQKDNTDQTLFTFGNQPVMVSEFEYVYNKNNISGKADYSEESLREYLELYINFRLKVKEAEALGLDTVTAINEELGTYRKQLAKSYLFDREVTDKLVAEVYERMKTELSAAHVFFKVADWGNVEDTLAAFRKANKVKKLLTKGGDFAKLAAQYSDDAANKENGGNLGFFFTALQTFYPFENAVYSLQKGQTSGIVKTKVGYHILKLLDSRPSRGKISVAHILLKAPKEANEAVWATLQKRAESVRQKIEGSAAFEDMVKEHSDDKYSKKQGGSLPEFGTGRMYPEFEEAAFALKNDGDVSKPVRTELGYHIIKRIGLKKLEPFKDLESDLKKKIEKDSRFNMAKNALAEKIMNNYDFKEDRSNVNALYEKIGDDWLKAMDENDGSDPYDLVLFSLKDASFSEMDFFEHLVSVQQKKRSAGTKENYLRLYDAYVQESLFAYEEARLENKYPDFKALMKEYHDGILLFELTDQMVWSKAIKDTAGLKKFHAAHKNDYMWNERVDAMIFTCKNADVAKAVRKSAKKKKFNVNKAIEEQNSETPDNLRYEEGKYEKGQNEIIDALTWEKGLSDDINNPDGSITFVKIKELLPSQPKSLSEAKGYIVSDYQEFLEAEWIANLRSKYPVEIKESVFQSLVK